jgi:hypothetical protein
MAVAGPLLRVYCTRTPDQNGKIAKSIFFDLQKIFYVPCNANARKFGVTPEKYCADSRPQNVGSVFPNKSYYKSTLRIGVEDPAIV